MSFLPFSHTNLLPKKNSKTAPQASTLQQVWHLFLGDEPITISVCRSHGLPHVIFGRVFFPTNGGEIPNKPLRFFLLKLDHDLRCEMGRNPPFKETAI